MLDGLDEALEGLSAGEETSFDRHAGRRRARGRRRRTVKVKVNSVKAEELPELERRVRFQDASEFDTLDELKADVRKAAAQRRRRSSGHRGSRCLHRQACRKALEIPVPKGVKANMVEAAAQGHDRRTRRRPPRSRRLEAEETVEKDLRRSDGARRPGREAGRSRCPRPTSLNFLASIAQQYGMDPSDVHPGHRQERPARLRRAGSRPLQGPARRHARRHVHRPMARPWTCAAFLGEAAEDEESESVEAASAAAAVADELVREGRRDHRRC